MTYTELTRAFVACPAGDVARAAALVEEIATTLATDTTLTPDRRRYLYRLRKMWQARASGKDARWLDHGCRPGARPRKREVGACQDDRLNAQTTPSTPGPVVSSDPLDEIMRKYAR